MLTKEEIFEKLKTILIGMDDRNKELIANATMDTKLITELGLSSVSMLYLVIAIEETYDIEFDTESPFVTVGEVVDYIQSKLK